MRDRTIWAFRKRVQLVAQAGSIGFVFSLSFLVLIGLWGRSVTVWLDSTFAFGGIWFGFGLLSWATSIMLGRTIEGLQENLDLRTRWTETSSRRAMARLTAFGAGIMLGATAIGLFLT